MEEDNNIYYYCTKCFSIDIRVNKKGVIYCHHCGADAAKLDVTTFDVWDKLYQERYGGPLVKKKSVYDDLSDAYKEESPDIMTTEEALSNGMNVGEFCNRNLREK